MMVNILKKSSNIWVYGLVFLSSCLLKCISLIGYFNMKLVSDNIGVLIIPSMLSGSDWSELIQNIAYYGWGYYILFTPLFYWTDNPYIIYYVICFVNILVIGGIGVLIYHILNRYFFPDNGKIQVAAMAVLCTQFASIVPYAFNSELPVFLIVWLTAYFLIKCCLATDRKQILFTLCLAVILIWGSTIHTRLMVLWLMIAIGVVVIKLLAKKWIVHPAAFLTASLAGLVVNRMLKTYVVSKIWNVSSTGTLRNVDLVTIDKLQYAFLNLKLKVAVDIIVSNLYKLSMETYGLFPICMMVALISLYLLIKRKPLLSQMQMIAITYLSIFGLTLLCTVAGLIYYYAPDIAIGYDQGVENARFSGLTYLRYYFIYFGPIFIAAFYLLKEHLDIFVNKLKGTIIFLILLGVYIQLFVFPNLHESISNYILADFIKDDNNINDFVITMFLLIIGIGLMCLLFKKNKINIVIYAILCIGIIRNWNYTQSEFFALSASTRGGEAIYRIWDAAKTEITLPDTIYASSDTLAVTQFMLNDIPLKYGLPDQEIKDAVYYTTDKIDEAEELLKQNFRFYQIGKKEYLWIKGESLQTELEPYILSYLTSDFEICSDEFAYINLRKVGNYITAFQEYGSAEYTLSEPVDGTYEYTVTLTPVHVKNQNIGYLEIWADDIMLERQVLTKDMFAENHQITGSFSINETEGLKYILYLEKGSFIRNFNIQYSCLDTQKTFGISHSEELSLIAEVLGTLNVPLPVYVISEGDVYSRNTDFSYAEEKLKYKISGVIAAEKIKELDQNCYILCENDSNNRLIFSLVDKYRIVMRTSHYTLLLSENSANNKILDAYGIDGLSYNGKINIDYFRYVNGMLENNVNNHLEEGLYKIEIESSEGMKENQNVQLEIINHDYVIVDNSQRNNTIVWINGTDITQFNLLEPYSAYRKDAIAYIEKIAVNENTDRHLSFYKQNQNFYVTGCSEIENWGRWSVAPENQIIFPCNEKNEIAVELKLQSLLEQNIVIYANDHYIGQYHLYPSPTVITFTIPKEYLEGEFVRIMVEAEDTWLINEIYGNGDYRTVGVGYYYIDWRPVE